MTSVTRINEPTPGLIHLRVSRTTAALIPWVFVVRFRQKVMNMAYVIAEHHFHLPFFVRRNLNIPTRFPNLIVARASENKDGYSD